MVNRISSPTVILPTSARFSAATSQTLMGHCIDWKNCSFHLHQVRLALQERPNWVWGRNLCGLVVGQARFQCWQVGDPPRFGGDHGTHPSIMILSWSDPVTYQPSFTTRARHLAHPRPDMQVQSALLQFGFPLASLHLSEHQRPGPSHPTQISRHSKAKDQGLRDRAQNLSRLPNEPLKSWYMLSQSCKNSDKTNCVGSKREVGGWG